MTAKAAIGPKGLMNFCQNLQILLEMLQKC